MSYQKIIQLLQLEPHPEGGFYREMYRSDGKILNESLPVNITGVRNFATSIYFLLPSGRISAFHRIRQDEIWHFYKGSPLYLHNLTPKGEYSKILIGNDIENGEVPQFVVKAGNWFAASVVESNSYTLVGCTVAPGFDFADFELAEKAKMLKDFPQYKMLIEEFCIK